MTLWRQSSKNWRIKSPSSPPRCDNLESRIVRLESKNEITPPCKGRGGGKLKDNKDRDEEAILSQV
jgi:hypothetical protein